MKYFLFCLLALDSVLAFGGQPSAIYIHPNKGQWDSRILYNVEIAGGNFYLDREGYTIFLRNYKHHHDAKHESHENHEKSYAFKIKYINGNQNSAFETANSSPFYRNYFLGNDKSRWQSKVFSVQEVLRKEVYPGIDAQTIGTDGALKINYLVQPNADIQQLQLRYEGFDSLKILKDGSLQMLHPIGYISESAPIAWNIDANGNKQKVSVAYQVVNNVLSFVFPDGYNKNLPLVIDPILAFSTFTGATSDNWGFTAAPDAQGNAFGGGISFGAGYPASVGALDNSYNGGNVDAAVSKFSADGSQLLYSTYIGGNSSETPHSIVCNAAGEIYIFGVTGSADFPITANAFQATINGGNSANVNNIKFTTGSDIFIVKLNASGTNLLASTYVGGTKNDGVNLNSLNYNYGDQFRGDITLDAAGNVYVASTTYSADFPIVGTGSTNGGVQDAVIFKMNGSLSTMLWSTYLGGGNHDAAYSIQVANDGSVYVAGGTASVDLVFPAGIKTTSNGGIDGFIAKYNNVGQLQKGMFVGTPQYDQIYFLQLDLDQNIYVFGQTLGAMSITAGKYGIPNSGQFVKKFDSSLSTELWTTLIGSGLKQIDISPTAFLVSDCDDIYLAGWGGSVNSSYSQAKKSSTNGLPVTSDAYQPNTNGSNFYIAVLRPETVGLKYGTFIGGVSSSANHVDGGTSRFDKSGKIYHSVCAACGGNANGFTTTPGVYSPTNKSSNCNMAVFKFEVSFVKANITNINPVICYPDQITFNNVSTSGGTFYWDFGDGTTSNLLNPTHTYVNPGNYTVRFVVMDDENCYVSDTSKFTVVVKDFNVDVSVPPSRVCPNVGVPLQATGGTSYLWSPAEFLDNPTSANPTANVSTTTTFMVIIQGEECGVDTAYTTVKVFEDSIIISKDTTICLGSSLVISADGLTSYNWTPSTYLNDATIATPTATPTADISYEVSGVSNNNCPLKATTTIQVITPPQTVMPDSLFLCLGDSKTIQVSGANTYSWSPNIEINTTSGAQVIVTPSQSRYYYCEISNLCGTIRDSVYVSVIKAAIHAWGDTTICPGETAPLFASGAKTYTWTPTVTFIETDGSIVTAKPTSSTTYIVTGTDQYGCKANAKVNVKLFPTPVVQTIPDVWATLGDSIQLGIQTEGEGIYIWSPGEFLSCTECEAPYTSPNKDYEYTVTYIDENGCKASDRIKVHYEPLLYIPNAFTPDGNTINEYFRIYGTNIDDITLDIYNRWGELIHTIRGMDEYWDGTYKGLPCPIGTYVWKIEYTDVVKDIILVKTGHVNLLR